MYPAHNDISMINIASKAGNYLRATNQVVASGLKPLAGAALAEKKVKTDKKEVSTVWSLTQALPAQNVSIKAGVATTTQVRFAHTDIQVPDFSDYRRDSTKRAATRAQTAEERKAFTYLLVGGAAVASAYSAKALVHKFIGSMSASADVLALAKIEIKLADIPEGKNVTFKWRGKPLFIRHRTAEEIAAEQSVALSTLRDVQHDNERTQNPKWLVVLGVCTHLGCVPIANSGDYGGYYCPCHGSHYDASGRIRKGPAPLNLEVPPYSFPDEGLLIVG